MPSSADVILQLRRAKAYIYGDERRRRIMRRETILDVLHKHVTPMIVVEDRGLRYLIETGDPSELTQRIFERGHYEEALMGRALQALGAARGGNGSGPLQGKVFLDVGGNIGTASVVAL